MRILRVGLKGPDVLDLQNKLNAQGAGLTEDGYFGPATEKAVKQFQVNKGLSPDGVVGPATWSALTGAAPTPAPTPSGRPQPDYPTLAQLDARYDKGTPKWYQNAYLIQKPDPGMESSIAAAARRVMIHKNDLYVPLEKLRGVPWAMTAVIHSMECNNNIAGCLHNGELIVGTSRKTKLVPRGRGPFNKKRSMEENWLDAALDAVDIQSLWQVPAWSIGYMLKQIELFNGTGYLRYHHKENSPYLWARTNVNDGTGKYVADGKWDEDANANGQVGAAAILAQLEAWGEFTPLYL